MLRVPIEIFLEGPDDDCVVEGTAATTIDNIKATIHEIKGIPPDQQHLTLFAADGTGIATDPPGGRTLGSYNIQNYVHVEIALR